MTHRTPSDVAPGLITLAVVLLAMLLGGLLFIRKSGVAPGSVARPVAPPAVPASQRAEEPAEVGAFHGGGPLLGEAPPLHAPPMKLRWRFRTDDDPGPASPPSGAPSDLPAAGPSTAAATQPAQRPQPGHFEAAAAIANSAVYVADTAGVLRKIDLASGRVVWSFLAPDGFETTPLALDGRVLLGDLGGLFHAVAADSGKELWKFDTGAPIHSSANYVGPNHDRIVFGNDGADIFCLDAATGKTLWNDKAGDRINGAPSVANDLALVCGCDAELRALRASDGKEQFAIELKELCPGSTAVAGDRMVLGTDQGRLLCLSAASQKELWLFDAIGDHAMVYSSPAIADNVVVIGARDRNVYGIDLLSGKKRWSFATRGDVDASPVIAGGRVYVASKDKKLYILDLQSGRQLWSFTAGRGITATPAIGDGALIFGDTGGNLFCLE